MPIGMLSHLVIQKLNVITVDYLPNIEMNMGIR